jgi:hypothetical protein
MAELQSISLLRQPIREIDRGLRRLALIQAVLGDEASKERTVDPARHVMARRNG